MDILLFAIIVLGCGAFQYLKGTFVRAFAMIITAMCSIIVAFGFFEVVADKLFISRADGAIFTHRRHVSAMPESLP